MDKDADWQYMDKYYNGVVDFLSCGPAEPDCGSIAALQQLAKDMAARARHSPLSTDRQLNQLAWARENAYMNLHAYLNCVLEIKKGYRHSRSMDNKLEEKKNI